jgi:CheY-like chemotaxis protein
LPVQPHTACRILVVEDDHITRHALVRVLSLGGYHPVAAATVAEGLAKLDSQACAILDLNLPDGFGTQILKQIRSEGLPIQVAVATGTTDDEAFSEAECHHPDLLLRKPIDLDILLEWLHAAV